MSLVVFSGDLSAALLGRLTAYFLITTVVMGFVAREVRWGSSRVFCAYPIVFIALVVWGMRR